MFGQGNLSVCHMKKNMGKFDPSCRFHRAYSVRESGGGENYEKSYLTCFKTHLFSKDSSIAVEWQPLF